MIPPVRPVTCLVKTPVPAVSAITLVTPVPPIVGLELALVRENTTPRSVTLAPPSAVTFPPRVARVDQTAELVCEVTVGTARRVTEIV